MPDNPAPSNGPNGLPHFSTCGGACGGRYAPVSRWGYNANGWVYLCAEDLAIARARVEKAKS